MNKNLKYAIFKKVFLYWQRDKILSLITKYGCGSALAAYLKIMMELLIQHYVFDILTSFRK